MESADAGANVRRRAAHAPVRVMHIVHTLRTGGMEMGVVKLVNGLDPTRVQSAICSTTTAGEIKQLVVPRVPVFELSRRAGHDLRVIVDLQRLLRRERPHIVHTHAWGTLLEGLSAARLARVPIVIHGEHGTLQLRAHQRWLQRRGWSAVDRVLSVSSRLTARMSKEIGFPIAGITTIRNGVDLVRFHATDRVAARRALDLASDAWVVGTVGRLVPVKDHATLIDAMGEIHRSGCPATLVIAGDGPERTALEAQVTSAGLGRVVRLLGHRPDVENVLAALDIFVLSSVSEGLSNTILEAMAAGRPVVATRVGGADEMIEDGETGILVEPGSPLELAAAIRGLFADTDRRERMGAAGRRRVEIEFALDGTIRRYDALYTELALTRGLGVSVEPASVESFRRSGAA